MKTRNIATALAFALIGTAALAQDPSYEPLQPITFAKSRADVTAELLQARAETKVQALHVGAIGVQDVTAISAPQTADVASLTRDEVRAETREAARSGGLARASAKGFGADDRFTVAGVTGRSAATN